MVSLKFTACHASTEGYSLKVLKNTGYQFPLDDNFVSFINF